MSVCYRTEMRVVVFVLLTVMVKCGTVTENVVFQKVNDVTTTRAKWLVTFITDLSPYLKGMDRLERDINHAFSMVQEAILYYNERVHLERAGEAPTPTDHKEQAYVMTRAMLAAWQARKHYEQGQTPPPGLLNKLQLHLTPPNEPPTKALIANSLPYKEGFARLGRDVIVLKEKLSSLRGDFEEYHSLHRGTPIQKGKRSLIPVIGQALGYLFGTVSESDLKAVQDSVHTLAERQENIVHVLEKELTLVNESRLEISENRRVINQLSEGLALLDKRLENITEYMHERILRLEMFVINYVELDTVIAEIRDIMQHLTVHLEHLQLQINLLALGRLTPSTVTPHDLRNLLSSISQQIKPPFKLTADPTEDLWHYYRHLTCSTMFVGNSIAVIVPIPLSDVHEEFEVYRIYNLPFPSVHSPQFGMPITASYVIESEGIAINKERTQFALLSESELVACTHSLLGLCAIRSPIYPFYSNTFCVTALFKKQPTLINQQCHVSIGLNTSLPQATYIPDGHWVIATLTPLIFNVLCQDGRPFKITATPPVDTVTLDKTCVASSESLILTAYYQRESVYQISSSILEDLSRYATSNATIWKPLHNQLPHHPSLKIPARLRSVKSIEMQPLIAALSPPLSDKVTYWPWWKICVIIIITVGTGAILIAIVCILRKYCCKQGLPGFMAQWRMGRPLEHSASLNQPAAPEDRGGEMVALGEASPLHDNVVQVSLMTGNDQYRIA